MGEVNVLRIERLGLRKMLRKAPHDNQLFIIGQMRGSIHKVILNITTNEIKREEFQRMDNQLHEMSYHLRRITLESSGELTPDAIEMELDKWDELYLGEWGK